MFPKHTLRGWPGLFFINCFCLVNVLKKFTTLLLKKCIFHNIKNHYTSQNGRKTERRRKMLIFGPKIFDLRIVYKDKTFFSSSNKYISFFASKLYLKGPNWDFFLNQKFCFVNRGNFSVSYFFVNPDLSLKPISVEALFSLILI